MIGSIIIAVAGYGLALLSLLCVLVQVRPPYHGRELHNAFFYLVAALAAAALTRALLA